MPGIIAKRLLIVTFFGALCWARPCGGQEPTPEQVIAKIDAAVQTRTEHLTGYTVLEQYKLYRGSDVTHSVAEMNVKTTYQRSTGKSYEIVSEHGSELLRKMVLHAILDHEKEINRPGNRENAYFVSSNYTMTPRTGQLETIDGRACYVVQIAPKPKSQNLVRGTLWADRETGQIVRVQGQIQKGLSLSSGSVQVFRKYANLEGFSEATFAQAVSNSLLFGRTTVTIEYSGYRIARQ